VKKSASYNPRKALAEILKKLASVSDTHERDELVGQANTLRLQISFEDTERAYGGKAAYEKAKQAGKTKLNFRQWVQVRTPKFRKWFGDWEVARGVQKLDALKPANLDDVKPAEDQKAVEALFRGFGLVENREDERSVIFPVGMAGKLIGHKGLIFGRLPERSTGSSPMLCRWLQNWKKRGRAQGSHQQYLRLSQLCDEIRAWREDVLHPVQRTTDEGKGE
jgi:hypothetical protein